MYKIDFQFITNRNIYIIIIIFSFSLRFYFYVCGEIRSYLNSNYLIIYFVILLGKGSLQHASSSAAFCHLFLNIPNSSNDLIRTYTDDKCDPHRILNTNDFVKQY